MNCLGVKWTLILGSSFHLSSFFFFFVFSFPLSLYCNVLRMFASKIMRSKYCDGTYESKMGVIRRKMNYGLLEEVSFLNFCRRAVLFLLCVYRCFNKYFCQWKCYNGLRFRKLNKDMFLETSITYIKRFLEGWYYFSSTQSEYTKIFA